MVSAAVEQLAPTAVEGEAIAFRLADPEHALPGARVWCDLDLGAVLDLAEVPGGWELRLPLPDLDCLEYLFEIPADGAAELRPDPGNPLTVDGAFGEHSWLPMPGYAAPAWLDLPAVEAVRRPVTVAGTPLGSARGGDLGAGRRRPRASRCRCCSPTTAPRWTSSPG